MKAYATVKEYVAYHAWWLMCDSKRHWEGAFDPFPCFVGMQYKIVSNNGERHMRICSHTVLMSIS